MTPLDCRACGARVSDTVLDLGSTPLANSFLLPERLSTPELWLPLRAMVCASCFLVQLDEAQTPEAIFSDYAYLSSVSSTWSGHAQRFASDAIARLSLGPNSRVVEVASNDGYLLRHFVDRGIPALGIEPAANVAAVAVRAGVPTSVGFFGAALAAQMAGDGKADLLIANNVIAHVPNLHDFVEGLRILLAPEGTLSLEFPHLLRMIEGCQWDTIYHEHFSYFSLAVIERVLADHRLQVVSVEELPTHGGSLRVSAQHQALDGALGPGVEEVRASERSVGLCSIATYDGFAERVEADKRALLAVLGDLRESGLSVAGYGAPAKANTLLNCCGIGTDLVEFTVDASPEKQGRFLPGSHIPVYAPDELRARKPDVVFVLPWNIAPEVMSAAAFVRDWGGRFLLNRPKIAIA